MSRQLIIFLLMIAASTAGWYWFKNLSNEVELAVEPIGTTEENDSTVPNKIAEKTKLPLAVSVKAIKANNLQTNSTTTPEEIRAVYLTAQTASNTIRINQIINLIESTSLNSVVINVKDGNEIFIEHWMDRLVDSLNEKGIYPIARIVLFQDNYTAQTRPDLALKNPDGNLWGKRGYYWLDPASKEVWDYNAKVAIEALNMGFKEINFDYVRFPDGNVDDIVYPVYNYDRLKKDVINEAAGYINKKIKEAHPNAAISLDIFAYSFLRLNDIGVGQKLTELANYYDVIAPMIYPSHYDPGNFGFANPAENPYEVVSQTLFAGKAQFAAINKDIIIRPWIQDFNMDAVYDREEVQAQIKAINDVLGINSWMAWNPNNIYHIGKYSY